MFPLVIAETGLNRFLVALENAAPGLRELREGQESVLPSEDGELILVGQAGPHCYLLDYSATPFADSWGLLGRLAAELNCLVVATAHDPSEEQAEFVAARGGQTLRAYWQNPERTTAPYSEGQALASEEAVPLGAAGGAGLCAALRCLGFQQMDHAEGFTRTPGDRWLTWGGDPLAVMDRYGSKAISDHVRAHMNPSYRWPTPKVRVGVE